MAGTTGLEPATSAVTGQRSNQLSYVPKIVFKILAVSYIESGFSSFRFSPHPINLLLWSRKLNAKLNTRIVTVTTK